MQVTCFVKHWNHHTMSGAFDCMKRWSTFLMELMQVGFIQQIEFSSH
jgi:hypothetical protein